MVGSLQHVLSFLDVADTGVHTDHVGVHPVGDGQTRGIILGAVDTKTSTQALHGGVQGVGRLGKRVLSDHGGVVSLNGDSHNQYSLSKY
ncbi:hypothetical protein D3C79_1028090 [compost metagenome]